MNNERTQVTAAALAALVGGRVVAGDGEILIERVASLESAEAGAISFVEEQKFLAGARASRASCLLVPQGTSEALTGAMSDATTDVITNATADALSVATTDAAVMTTTDATTAGEVAAASTVSEFAATLIEVARPKLAFALVAEKLHPPERRAGEVAASATVAASAQIGAGVFLGAGVCVGERVEIGAGTQVLAGAVLADDVRVGADCVIHPHVVLYRNTRIGDRVILHAGVVVGADGFGYVRDGAAGYRKFPQVGAVGIEDDVEIGANSCVDRGALGLTRIGRGTKLDNLVHVGHNVEIGERVVIAAQTGISGSTVIESDAVIGGQVGMGDHARVEAGAIVGSKAGILPGKIVRAGAVVWGVPVRPLAEYKRLNAHFGRLPQMRAEIDELKRQVRELTARLTDDAER